MQKRHIFIRGYVKLFSVCSSRYKSVMQSKESVLINVINSLLDHVESVVQDENELTDILGEVLVLLNVTNINNIILKCFTSWINNRSGSGIVVKGLLRTLAISVTDCDIVSVLLEATLSVYFHNRGIFLLLI